ncbi:MAG: TIGR03619 family F420-dependent LLM class oxidoreductase [Pseudomonadales bacterium]
MQSVKLSLGAYGLENLFGGDYSKVVAAAVLAEQLGYDKVSFTDHVVMGENTDRYPYGPFPATPDTPWIDPLVILSSIIGATQSIHLSTSVLIAPLRPAPLLAKMVASMDQLSKGRMELGVGTGWQREEYEASGIPFKGRRKRLDEYIAACKALWGDAPTNFSADTVTLDHIYCRPAPMQAGGVPILFGVEPNEANAASIARLGDGWIPINPDPEYIASGVTNLRAAFAHAGRDPAQIRVRTTLAPQFDSSGVPNLEATLAQANAAVEAGATEIEFLPIIFAQSAERLQPVLEQALTVKA